MMKASVRDMTASLAMLRIALQSGKQVKLSKELWSLFNQFDKLREEMGYSGVAIGDLTEQTEEAWRVER